MKYFCDLQTYDWISEIHWDLSNILCALCQTQIKNSMFSERTVGPIEL